MYEKLKNSGFKLYMFATNLCFCFITLRFPKLHCIEGLSWVLPQCNTLLAIHFLLTTTHGIHFPIMQYSEGVQLLISYVWVARRWGTSRCTDDDDDDGGDHDELHSNDFLCYEGIVTTLLLLLREMGIEERSLASISDYFHIRVGAPVIIMANLMMVATSVVIPSKLTANHNFFIMSDWWHIFGNSSRFLPDLKIWSWQRHSWAQCCRMQTQQKQVHREFIDQQLFHLHWNALIDLLPPVLNLGVGFKKTMSVIVV